MLFWWFAETTLIAGLLAVVALAVGRLRSLGPSTRHLLWLVVLIKMMTPPIIHAPSPLQAWEFGDREVQVEDSHEISSEIDENKQTFISHLTPAPIPRVSSQRLVLRHLIDKAVMAKIKSSPRVEDAAGVVDVRSRDSASRGTSPLAFDFGTIREWALGTWLALSLTLAAGQGLRLLRFRRKLRLDESPPTWLRDEIGMMADRFGVREPEAFVVDGLGSPLLWCLGTPKLLLPRRLVETLSADRWRGVLAHEMAHIKRGDPWVGRLELAAGLVWWWNPLFWIVRGRLDAEAELACDAWVVWALPDDRLLYAETVLDICEVLSRSMPSAKPSALVLGVTRAGELFERRLSMIVREHVSNRLSVPALIGAGMLIVLGLPSWTLAEPPAAEVGKAEVQVNEGKAQTDKAAADAEALAAKLEAEAGATAERVEGEAERVAALAERDQRGGKEAKQEADDEDEDEDEDEDGDDEEDDKAKAKAKSKADKDADDDKAKMKADKDDDEDEADDEEDEDEDEDDNKAKVKTGKEGIKEQVIGRILKQIEVIADDDDADDEDEADDEEDDDDGDDDKKGKAKDKAKDKSNGKSGKKDVEQVEFEFDFSKVGEVLGPEFLEKLKKGVEEIEEAIGPEISKALEKIGPEIEKAVKEQLGPDFEKKIKDFSDKLEKELSEKLGPGSDFEKSVKEFAEAFEQNFASKMKDGKGDDEVKQDEKPEVREESKGRLLKRRAERAEARKNKKKAEAESRAKATESEAKAKESDAKAAELKAKEKHIKDLEEQINQLYNELKKLKGDKEEEKSKSDVKPTVA